MNTKVAWGIMVLIIVAGGLYAYSLSSSRKAPVASVTENVDVPPLTLQATVTSVSPDKLEIIVTKDSVEKTVVIHPATKIEKMLSQKSTSSTEGKQASLEVNISDLTKGDVVTIEYQSEKASTLDGVSKISFTTVVDSIDTYLKQLAQADTSRYAKGTIVSVDLAGKNIQFTTVGTTTESSVPIPDGVAVYRVDDSLRAPITHARTAATLADLKTGEIFSFSLDTNMLKEGKIVPQAFIISLK